jgi:hypothetical protein
MKLKYQKKEDVPEELIQYYVESGDKWILGAAQELISENVEITKNNEAQLATSKIERAALAEVTEIAIPKKGAILDVMVRALNTFTINSDGEFAAVDDDGLPRFDKRGKRLNPKSWARELLEDASHLFEEDETRKKPAEPAAAKRSSGSTISKAQVDGKSLQSDLLSSIASGETTVV